LTYHEYLAQIAKAGEPLNSGSVAEVVLSKHPDWKVGDIVSADLPWQRAITLRPSAGWRRVDPALAPISSAAGILGMPGRTGFFGLLDICNPKAGETLLVSGAAGAIGLLVGQMGKILGFEFFEISLHCLL